MSTRGSDASRPPSRSRSNKPVSVLQPRSSTPHTFHNINDNESVSSQSQSLARKRRRDSPTVALEELLKPVITIKPQFSLGATSDRPFILKPLMLLSRECLPLSSLDLSTPNGEFPTGPGRFYESHIRILDLDGRLRQAPSVLIARSDTTRSVYALERHQAGLYVVCKLGAWVSIEKLSNVAEACYASRCYPAQTIEAMQREAATTTPHLYQESKRKRLAIEELQSMVQKRPRTTPVASSVPQMAQAQPPVQPQDTDQTPSSATSLEPAAAHADSALPVPPASQSGPLDLMADTQMTAEDIFQSIRSSCFEYLYHNKGSLAYFAKGPLSRARAAFHFDCDATLDVNDLSNFLKSLVVAIPQIDKKYKETVPKLIDEMKVMVETSEEDVPQVKRRKSKKMKLGKDGLWSNEVEQVKKWWRANKPQVREDDSRINPQEVKYHIACLRTRETQLQMIILLEVLALEATRPAPDADDSQLPGMPAEVPVQEKTVEPVPKKKTKHDFPLLVNLHADRMSIWQSTTLDEMHMIAAEAQAKSGLQSQKSTRANSDPLKDFCIDIVVPFFAGRLPEMSADLNRKLGGPVATSPPKPKKPVVPVASKNSTKPGTAAQRHVAAKAPRSLGKVFESDQQKRKASRKVPDVLARLRSATPVVIPGLKREGSEPLGLDRVSQGDRFLKERSRNVLSRSVSTSGADEVKAQKKAKVEAELQEAISALKKPNRQMAGKCIVDEVEKRTGSSSSPHPRKQKKPVRNAAAAAANNVQVKATPANFRFRDAFSADSRGIDNIYPPPPRTEFDTIPSSSSIVPGTAPRKSFRDDLRDDLAAFHIASTPAKSATQFAKPSVNYDFIPPSSPIISRKTAPAARTYPTIPEEAEIEPSSPVLARIFETPVKQRAQLPPTFTDEIGSTPPEPRPRTVLFATPAKKALTSAPAAPSAPAERTRVSTTSHTQPASTLYQQMGWDDDYYDNLIS